MQTWNEVRQHVLTDKKSKRSACAKFNIHWGTLKKILASSEPQPYTLAKPRPRPTLGEFMPIVEQILSDDRQAPPKQKHTAKRIWDRLRAEYGFTGGYTIVKDVVRDWRQTNQEVFVPLTHHPGEAQMDFGEAVVRIAGEEVKAHLCVLTLPYSDVFYVQAYPRECAETFFDGHVRAFLFFGGVPTRISYDNSRIPVKRIIGPHDRELTDGFLRFQSHHLFKSHFCRVRCPNEKGHVETLVQYARNNFLVPVPEAASFDALNEMLHRRCAEELERNCRGEVGTKGERLAEDRKAFRDLPAEMFEAKKTCMTCVGKLSLVRFDCNDYSVPVEYGHHAVCAIGTADEVRFAVQGETVAVHRRIWEKERTSYDPIHYLALLEKKPGALDYAKPLENFGLPPCFEVLRRRLEGEFGKKGVKEYIRVLRLLEKAEVAELKQAVEKALDIGVSTADAVRVILEGCKEKPVDPFRLDGHPHLKLVKVEPPDLGAYRMLLDLHHATPALRLTGGAQ